jgi:uncharacterized protein YoaH (UPF0181 family)
VKNTANFCNLIGNLKGNFMTIEKTFSVAGTAKNPDGTVKARFANDLVARIKILNKAGCTDINLMELPHAMTKLEALQYLQTQGITEGDAGFVVANKLAEKNKVAKKGEVKVQATKAPKATKKVTAEQLVQEAAE